MLETSPAQDANPPLGAANQPVAHWVANQYIERMVFSRIPLLWDRHTHPLLYAGFMDGVDLGRDASATRDQALRRIRAGVACRDGWTIAHGWNSGRYRLAKEDFDDLPPLVVFDLSLHGLIVNDAGRALLGQSDPVTAENLDSQEWTERNLRSLLNVFARQGASVERLQRFYRWLLEECGVYRADEMLLADQDEIQLFEEAGLAGRTTFWASPDLYRRLPRPLQEQVHGVKLFADGALGTRTAGLHVPYQHSTASGMLLYETSELEGLVRRYLDANKPIALHAIGDRAIDQVVAAIESARPREAAEVRIEHAQFISEATARRAKSLGIGLCMQPNFSEDSICYVDRLPEGYAERNNPFRMLIDRVGYAPGVDLLLGSDGMPHGVGEGLRQSLFPPHAGQTLTVEEFAAGYGGAGWEAGHIEIRVDPDQRQVTHRVVLGGEDAVGDAWATSFRSD